MHNLNSVIDVETLHELYEYTNLRFVDRTKYRCAEALGLYEQKILPIDKIMDLCKQEVGRILYEPVNSFVPDNIIRAFANTVLVPVSFSPMKGLITCVYLEELGNSYVPIAGYKVEVLETTIYYYFTHYTMYYGVHRDLANIPAKQLITAIINEGVFLQASDITISSLGKSARVYYNVRKKKVYSQRIINGENMEDIIKYFTIESPMNFSSYTPKYVGFDLNEHYRGRIVINTKYKGYALTIRLLPNAIFNLDLESCNLSKETIEFLREAFMGRELGLRIIAGSTMAGKNTTALCVLKELTEDDEYKVVSIEMPVEQELNSIEQINCETDEDYETNIQSLIRQNPDFVYITEIGDTTGLSILKTANTGKRILSTIHANSCGDVISRLQDITGLSTDRIIQSIQSIVYQELIRDDKNDVVRPKNKYVQLTQDRKIQLYGKPYGEIISKINEWEGGDVW